MSRREELKAERRARVEELVAGGMSNMRAYEACADLTRQIAEEFGPAALTAREVLTPAPRDHRHAAVERDLITLASTRMPGIEWPLP